jgi:NOL1/NOP2/fmu family ribosome biogenesis protein
MCDESGIQKYDMNSEFDRVWVPILKWDSKDLRPLHQLGIIFWSQATQNTVELDMVWIQKYIAWQDFQIENDQVWFVILQHEGRGVGVGKMVKWLLKNKFMKLM